MNNESAAVEAVAWDYCPELRIAVTNGKGGANMTLNGHGAPAGISLYHGDYVSELQSALDALRGEVAAAERRVAELEKLTEAVTWFDWSDNGEDVVQAIDSLRNAIEEKRAALTKVTP